MQNGNRYNEPTSSQNCNSNITSSEGSLKSTTRNYTSKSSSVSSIYRVPPVRKFRLGDSLPSRTNIHSTNASDIYTGMIRSLPELADDSSMTDVVIDTVNETEPTSTILDFCKRNFIQPYFSLLATVGLHPNATDISSFWLCCSNFQTTLVFLFLCCGYVLQYLSKFRRDRGFTPNEVHTKHHPTVIIIEDSTNSSTSASSSSALSTYRIVVYNFGEIFFAYLIPSIVHLFGFIAAIYVFRIADNEQLQNLIERVFLLSTNIKCLCIRLWCYVFGGFLWLGLLLSYLILSVIHHPDILKLPKYILTDMNSNWQHIAKVFLILTIFAHDFVQMIVLTSFCIECYLLRLHLFNLKEKLLHHTIESIDWMREVIEFHKLLNHLNNRVATPVCFFTILNLTYAFAGIIYLFKEYDFNSPIKIFSLNVASIIIWLLIGLLPFFQAASVTRICKMAQSSGHQIRVRPFVYDNASNDDLNSTLLFASSLNMSAKLFRMPIQGNYLCFTILIISIVILTLGMCLNVSLGIL